MAIALVNQPPHFFAKSPIIHHPQFLVYLEGWLNHDQKQRITGGF